MLAYSNTRKHFSTITKCISTIIPSNFIYCVRQSILSVHLITTISFHDASVVPSPGSGWTGTFPKLYCNTSSCQSPGIEVQVHLTQKFTGLLWSVVIFPNNICRSTHITQFTTNLHNTSLSTNLILLKGWLGPQPIYLLPLEPFHKGVLYFLPLSHRSIFTHALQSR